MVRAAPAVEPEKTMGFVGVEGSSVIKLNVAECEALVTAPGV